MSKVLLLEAILDDFADQLDMTKSSERDSVFELFVAEQLLKDKDLDSDELENGIIGGSFDNGIDGMFIFANDELIQSIEQVSNFKSIKNIEVHFHQYKNNERISEDVVHKFNTATSNILNLSQELSPTSWNIDLIEKVKLLRNLTIRSAVAHPEYKFIYRHISKGNRDNIYNEDRPNESYLDKVATLKNTVEKSDYSNVLFVFDYIGVNELISLNRNEKQFSIALKLNENPIALDFSDDGKRGYIASVNIKDYFKFITEESGELRKYLFDSNIRDYQNNTEVNTQISGTIKNDKDLDFWWLNNGVTIIADKGSLTGKTLHLDNVQIVNGLQTSHSIYYSYNKEVDDENRSLLLKIIITDDKVTADKIIKSTNSQNKVPTSLLRATDRVQRDIEEYFLTKDYYYDRRKNYYKNLKKPTKKIISINFLAQCLTSLLIQEKNPSKARSNPTVLTKKDEDYAKLFPENRHLDTYLKSIIVVKNVEIHLKQLLNGDELAEQIKKYFLFHVSRVSMSVLFQQPNYGEEQFRNVNLDLVNEELVAKSVEWLKRIISKYLEETEYKDVVNISKQSEFSQYITDKLIELIAEARQVSV
ncbi:AIPR family protein [Bacillus tropicus]|uniref:AIPR family protein n=1 Tax=Bacillus tropicus TaxID=2026188 RepID=UPI00207A6B5C|nr:AIPR family protein [Bacillus tropicus]USK97912.1 AIPR family protein [Bacillus tropicus]